MPIEIRELVIRASVNPGDERRSERPANVAREPARNDELIQSCVQEVLRVLESRMER